MRLPLLLVAALVAACPYTPNEHYACGSDLDCAVLLPLGFECRAGRCELRDGFSLPGLSSTSSSSGGRWTEVAGVAGTLIGSIHGSGRDDAWLVHIDGVVRHWDGRGWTERSPPGASQLNAVYARSGTDVVVGGIGAWRWNGAWQALPTPSATIRSLVITPDGDVWSVGSSQVDHLRAGGTWDAPRQGTELYDAIGGSDADSLFAVGDLGLVSRRAGGTWVDERAGSAPLHAVSVESVAHAWAAGAGGTLREWTGTSWQARESGTTENLASMARTPSGVLWIGGGHGTVVRWEGGGRVEQLPTTAAVTAIWTAGDDEVAWAGTALGDLFRRDP